MLIQLIDDSDANLFVFIQMLKKSGYRVSAHSDPVQALAAFNEMKPDAVIVDYMMPNMDGIEYIREVRRRLGGEFIPVVLITAATESDVHQRAMAAGASDFLVKPLTFAVLRDRMNAILPVTGE